MRVVERGLMLVIGWVLCVGMGTIGFPSIAKADEDYPSHSDLEVRTILQGKKTRHVVHKQNNDNIKEFSQQHSMIKDDLAAAQAAIQADLATLQAAVDALEPGTGGLACGAGTTVGRFVINGGEACDTKTGLKWQETPDSTLRNHADALVHCTGLGGGYRLPEIQELHSVLDYAEFNPALTPGVFSNINVLGFYWSATSRAANSDHAWLIRAETPNVPSAPKTYSFNAWCVR